MQFLFENGVCCGKRQVSGAKKAGNRLLSKNIFGETRTFKPILALSSYQSPPFQKRLEMDSVGQFAYRAMCQIKLKRHNVFSVCWKILSAFRPLKISMAEIYYPRKLLAGLYKIVELYPGGSAIRAQELPLKAHRLASAVAPALRLLTVPNLDDRYRNTGSRLSKEIRIRLKKKAKEQGKYKP